MAGQRWGNGGPYLGDPPGYQQPPAQWGAPPSPPPQEGPSGKLIAAILAVVAVLVGGGVAAAVVVSSGNDKPAAQAPTVTTATQSVTHTTTVPTVTQTVQTPAPPVGSPPTAGTTSCGGDLSVGPNTSCAFAQNVHAAYEASGGGNTTVTAFSPTTGRSYDMSCAPSGGVVVCTGGQGASVYFP